MNVVLSTRSFAMPGGSETYLQTLAEQLQRLGHEIVVFAEDTGTMSDFAESRGVRVTTDLRSLPDRCDGLVVQDGVVAYLLAERYPRTPQLFVAHSELHDLQLPPGLPGVVSGVVVLSDRMAWRPRQMAARPAVHRLRQPIDTERFTSAGEPPDKPRRAILLGNYLKGRRLNTIHEALSAHGVSTELIGTRGQLDLHPEHAIWNADFVVAKGRAALEGMACGKPVFVYDQFGGDGWVTADNYAALEADNFAGLAGPPVSTPARLAEELASYDPHMGAVNRELVISHHTARRHACEMCSLLGEIEPPADNAGAALRELARLVKLQWLTELRAVSLEETSRLAREDAERTRAELARLSERNAQLAQSEAQLARMTAELERHRHLARTRRVRMGLRLGTVADSARRMVAGR